jgi:hypothetical protein
MQDGVRRVGVPVDRAVASTSAEPHANNDLPEVVGPIEILNCCHPLIEFVLKMAKLHAR